MRDTMIGASGAYYRIEFVISDPRQKHVIWRAFGLEYKLRVDAISAARKFKGQRVRIMAVSEHCVWANNEALVANGDKVT